MVQQPLNPAVLEAARQLLDRTTLRWPDALQLAVALVARDMFQGTGIIFVSASQPLLEAAKAEGFHTLDPAKEAVEPVKETEQADEGR
jgi:predicted nucleic acid-binding protein